MKEDALTLVLLRNVFYRDGYRGAVLALFYCANRQLRIGGDIVLSIQKSAATAVFCDYPRWPPHQQLRFR